MTTIKNRSTGLSVGVAVSLLSVLAGGCSTVQSLSGAPRPGFQQDGSYVLSDEQQRLGCRELQERSLGLQEQLQALPTRAVNEMQELPKTVAGVWNRLTGASDQGVPALAAYNEAKAESAALNESLHRKGCSSVETATINR